MFFDVVSSFRFRVCFVSFVLVVDVEGRFSCFRPSADPFFSFFFPLMLLRGQSTAHCPFFFFFFFFFLKKKKKKKKKKGSVLCFDHGAASKERKKKKKDPPTVGNRKNVPRRRLPKQRKRNRRGIETRRRRRKTSTERGPSDRFSFSLMSPNTFFPPSRPVGRRRWRAEGKRPDDDGHPLSFPYLPMSGRVGVRRAAKEFRLSHQARPTR